MMLKKITLAVEGATFFVKWKYTAAGQAGSYLRRGRAAQSPASRLGPSLWAEKRAVRFLLFTLTYHFPFFFLIPSPFFLFSFVDFGLTGLFVPSQRVPLKACMIFFNTPQKVSLFSYTRNLYIAIREIFAVFLIGWVSFYPISHNLICRQLTIQIFVLELSTMKAFITGLNP